MFRTCKFLSKISHSIERFDVLDISFYVDIATICNTCCYCYNLNVWWTQYYYTLLYNIYSLVELNF